MGAAQRKGVSAAQVDFACTVFIGLREAGSTISPTCPRPNLKPALALNHEITRKLKSKIEHSRWPLVTGFGRGLAVNPARLQDICWISPRKWFQYRPFVARQR